MHALVFGGTGAVGSAVVRALAARGVSGVFTFRRSWAEAGALATQTGFDGACVDLADPQALRGFLDALPPIDAFIHAAGVAPTGALADTTDAAWDETHAVTVRAAFIAARSLVPGMAARGGGALVFVGALDRGQSLPLPVAFAAAQGALPALAMSLAKAHGAQGVRANVAALGLLDAGLSAGLDERARRDYLTFSAFRRLGTPAEVAPAIVWLALDAKAMNGKVLAVNGGV